MYTYILLHLFYKKDILQPFSVSWSSVSESGTAQPVDNKGHESISGTSQPQYCKTQVAVVSLPEVMHRCNQVFIYFFNIVRVVEFSRQLQCRRYCAAQIAPGLNMLRWSSVACVSRDGDPTLMWPLIHLPLHPPAVISTLGAILFVFLNLTKDPRRSSRVSSRKAFMLFALYVVHSRFWGLSPGRRGIHFKNIRGLEKLFRFSGARLANWEAQRFDLIYCFIFAL